MIEQTRNEKKLLAVMRAKFRLKQRLEAIDWEYDELKPAISEYKAQARLPELPDEAIAEVTFEYEEATKSEAA